MRSRREGWESPGRCTGPLYEEGTRGKARRGEGEGRGTTLR